MSEENVALTPANEETELSQVLTAGTIYNPLLDAKIMNMLFKQAKFFAGSKIVPQAYQGKVEDCFVACDIAARMNLSPIVVMQQLYVVQGKPSWSGQACFALIQNSGLFSDLHYVFVGEQGSDTWGCYLEGTSTKTGRTVKGAVVTIQMAKDEGWYNKSGSKWKTMPDQMVRYRAAAFFARTECPSAMMGFQTREEVEDITPEKTQPETVRLTLPTLPKKEEQTNA